MNYLTNASYNNSQFEEARNYVQNSLHMGMPTLRPAGVGGLLTTAMPILMLMIRLKNTTVQPDIEEMSKQVLEEIKAFDNKARKLGYHPKTVLAACYCLCTAFDEAVLGTVWGGRSAWVQHSLLSIIHKETWGGERFYVILNKMAEDPATNLDMLELLYMLLSLGFEGKYFEQHKNSRDEIRYTLFNLVRNYRESPKKTLSPSAVDGRVKAYHAQKRLPLKYIGIACAGVLLLAMTFFNYKSYSKASTLMNSLNAIAQVTLPASKVASNKQNPSYLPDSGDH